MAARQKIIIEKGAQIVEVREDKGVPQIRILHLDLTTIGTLQVDHQTGDSCWEFRFVGKNWTVDRNKATIVK